MESHLLNQDIEINSVQALKNIISEIKRLIENKKIEQFWPGNKTVFGKENICEIPEEGPFPDYIEWYFQEPETKKKFQLCVETYHGSGGHWSIIEN